MATMENLAFNMLASSGDAQNLQIEAIESAKNGNFEDATAKMKEAETLLLNAHEIQTELITKEAGGRSYKYSVIFVHAQNHLMNVILAQKLVAQMIDMYREIKK